MIYFSTSKEGRKVFKNIVWKWNDRKAVLNYTSNLEDDKVVKMMKMLKRYVQSKKDSAVHIIPINPAMELAIKYQLEDAQFLENQTFLSNKTAGLSELPIYWITIQVKATQNFKTLKLYVGYFNVYS